MAPTPHDEYSQWFQQQQQQKYESVGFGGMSSGSLGSFPCRCSSLQHFGWLRHSSHMPVLVSGRAEPQLCQMVEDMVPKEN